MNETNKVGKCAYCKKDIEFLTLHFIMTYKAGFHYMDGKKKKKDYKTMYSFNICESCFEPCIVEANNEQDKSNAD